MEKDKERLRIIEKIKEYEREGKFDIDVEDDPPTIPLKPNEVDFLRKKLSSKIKARFANKQAINFFNKLIKEEKVIIKETKGIENLQNLKDTGFIITCNHFNPFDTFTVEKTFIENKTNKKQKLYKVIREGNYTNFPGFYGLLMRNCYTLPLSENKHVLAEFLNATKAILKNKDAILIFPEESMWWNYRKPKPLKSGAFHIATQNSVPILPIFITMKDSKNIADDGFPIQEYIVNIKKPIYPDKTLTKKENIEKMKKENFNSWKETYESFYKKKLTYTTKNKEMIK